MSPTDAMVTICGLGSLLSETSSRTTFPDLVNFRLARIRGYRRVFSHPANIFFERNIADMSTLAIASLSAEPCEGASFVCTVFDVRDEGMEAFHLREEEYELEVVPYESIGSDSDQGTGLLCCRSTDAAFLARVGQEGFDRWTTDIGVPTVWGWEKDSGLKPCGVYLRHCVLAATKMGSACLDSFLDDTVLVDRVTTIREYLARHPEVMETPPPPSLAARYGG